MTKEERDKRNQILAELNACAKEEPQEPKKMTVEEFKDWMEKTAEQTLAIESFKCELERLTKSNAALTEKLDAAREAAGKAIEDRKILKEKADAQEKRIAELETLLDGYFLTKEENRKFRETICKMAAVIYG